MSHGEAQRQQNLLRALLAPQADVAALSLQQSDLRALRGLRAYRANAQASADRALSAVFPTVRKMVSEDTFRHLAHEFWRAHLPERGDLGEWGGELPMWLSAHTDMLDWPYLADCARLDLILYQNERAADAELDAESLMRLESVDPALLYLQLMPGVAVLSSRWPVVSIYQAHQLTGLEAEHAFDSLRTSLLTGVGEQVVVARQGWRAAVEAVDINTYRWMKNLLQGFALADALECAEPGFEFASWLAHALQKSWLHSLLHKQTIV
jgi:hypothetical protein